MRLKWIEFGRYNTAFLAKLIAQTVHSIAPKCRMGLQHAGYIAGSLYNGPHHMPIFKVMVKVTKMPVGSRPGGGFYNDHAPRDMILKAYDLGLQSALTPDCVSQICAEVENFTHTAMGKTPYGTAVESALDLALGCNSLSYAVLCANYEKMEWYALILKKLAEWRIFLEEFAELNVDTLPAGLYSAYSRDHIKRALRENETPFAWVNISFNALWLMSTIGLPVTVYPELACGRILKGETIEGMTDSEIERMLMGGVMADGVAALRLQERRFASVMGLKVEPRRHDVHEYLTDDSLNGEYAGHTWKIIFEPKAHV